MLICSIELLLQNVRHSIWVWQVVVWILTNVHQAGIEKVLLVLWVGLWPVKKNTTVSKVPKRSNDAIWQNERSSSRSRVLQIEADDI
jgi:hypothetical protein